MYLCIDIVNGRDPSVYAILDVFVKLFRGIDTRGDEGGDPKILSEPSKPWNASQTRHEN